MSDPKVEAPETSEETVDYESVAHRFTQEPGEKPEEKPEEKPPLASRVTPAEQRRRDLQNRFKRVRGYKPVERDPAKLEAMVVQAEQAAGIF